MAVMTSELIVRLRDMASSPARAVANSMARLRDAQRANARQMNEMRGRMLDATAAAYTLYRGISAPVNASRDFESALTDLADKGNMSTSQMNSFGAMARTIAPKVNQLSTEVVRGADYLVGMGLGIEATTKAMPAIGRAATGTRASIETLSSAAFAVIDNLKVPAERTASALDIMAYAGKEGGYELRDMAKDFPAMTASMQAFGSTGVNAVADLAAALQIVRKGAGSGAEAATNMNNILQKIVAPATVRKFKEFGIDIRKELVKAQKAGVSPIEMIVKQTQKALKGDLSKLGDLFEDSQVQKGLRPLLQQFEDYIDLRERAMKNSGGTVDQSFALQMDSNREKLKASKIKLNNMAISIGNALIPAINQVVDALGPLIEKVTEFADKHPEVVQAIAAITAGLVVMKATTSASRFAFFFLKGGMLDVVAVMPRVAGAILTLLNPLALVRASMVALRAATVSTGIGAIIVAIALAGLWIYENWAGLVEFFKGFGEGLREGLAPVMPAIQPIVDVGKALFDIISGMVGPIDATNSEWQSWGKTVGGVVAKAIRTVVDLIKGMVKWITKGIDAAKDFGNAVAGFWGGDDSGQAAPTAVQGRKARRNGRVPAIAGARAAGGAVKRGMTYLTGEEGAELFTPEADGYVHNHSDTKAMMRTGPSAGRDTSPGTKPGISMSFGDIILPDVRDAREFAREIGNIVKEEMAGIHADVEWSS